jgi:hypothetical protein
MEQAVYLLAILACPLGMGLMMLFMGRGMFARKRGASERVWPDADALKAEQARLAAQIEARGSATGEPASDGPHAARR